MNAALVQSQLRLAFRSLRTAQTHLGRARSELPLGAADARLWARQQEVERLISRLRNDYGSALDADNETAPAVEEAA